MSSVFPLPSPNEEEAEVCVKRRTRRKSLTVHQGNNRVGRRGRLRCLQCRKWRQKCEYATLELPCKLCKENGFQCGEKVFGPKTAHNVISNGATLPMTSAWGHNIEAQCLHNISIHLLRVPANHEMAMLHLEIPNLHGISACFPWLYFPLEYGSVRYATLALSSALYSVDGRSPNYLAGFYKYAIASSSTIEVVVSSYVALLCGFREDAPIETLLTYFDGIRHAFSIPSQEMSHSSISATSLVTLVCASFRTVLLAYLLRFPGHIELRREAYFMLLRTGIASCPYSQQNLGSLKMNGGEEFRGDFVLASDRHDRYCVDNLATLLPIESSLRGLMDWYMARSVEREGSRVLDMDAVK